MPVHRVHRASLHEELQRLTREGERIIDIINDAHDPLMCQVVTDIPSGVTELRGAAL